MYTQKKPIENTHIVREKDRQRNRELLAVLFLGVPVGLFLLLFTWQNLEVIRLGREATRLQKTLKDTEAEHKSLEAELDRLTSFETVEKKAAQLGFEATDPKKIVMVEKARAVSSSQWHDPSPVPEGGGATQLSASNTAGAAANSLPLSPPGRGEGGSAPARGNLEAGATVMTAGSRPGAGPGEGPRLVRKATPPHGGR